MSVKSVYQQLASGQGASFTSIERKLINSVSLVFGFFLFAVFLSVDIGLDDWVEDQFNQAMLNKANYLKSEISFNHDKVEFTADLRFLPEYSSEDDPHYFQIWHDGQTIGRSPTLSAYPNVNLIEPDIAIGEQRIIDVVMPNGELGKATLSNFVPQSDDGSIEAVSMTIYESAGGLDSLLWLVDGLLIGSFLLAIVVMRFVTKTIIRRGLAPLDKLNDDLKALSLADQHSVSELDVPDKRVEEIEPIRKELNRFIRSNQQLIKNEQRITGDIAHELKTPLAEMITLSEVHIRYPDDERISKTYPDDILAIAKRMKSIVEKLLLLQRTASPSLNLSKEALSIRAVFAQVKHDIEFKYPDVEQRLEQRCETDEWFLTDRFSLETILINLLDNALYYSPAQTRVEVRWRELAGDYELSISNHLNHTISQEQLDKMVQPLFQIDDSRTNNERFGLGLSIINNICQQHGYRLDFSLPEPLKLTVSIGIPKIGSQVEDDLPEQDVLA